jgi:hypothetical protein
MNQPPTSPAVHESPNAPKVDIAERSKTASSPLSEMNRRLFMQLLVFDVPTEREPERQIARLCETLSGNKANAVIYEDANHPYGYGLLTFSEDPSDFVTRVRPAFAGLPFTLRPEFTMLGRTYSTGYESDLEYWLLRRPAETVKNTSWPWAVWYPLRRSGAFARLEGREQGSILREHGEIGRAYGEQDLAHDVRLACHGLDASDNEFVIGLIGKELYPLSHVVQAMRKTRQTAEFINQMGPFFVGRTLRVISS